MAKKGNIVPIEKPVFGQIAPLPIACGISRKDVLLQVQSPTGPLTPKSIQSLPIISNAACVVDSSAALAALRARNMPLMFIKPQGQIPDSDLLQPDENGLIPAVVVYLPVADALNLNAEEEDKNVVTKDQNTSTENDETFKCKFCSVTFETKTRLLTHRCRVLKKKYFCKLCHMDLKDDVKFKLHARNPNGCASLLCHICCKYFIDDSCSDEGIIKCKECEKRLRAGISVKKSKSVACTEELTRNRNATYTCEFCSKVFTCLSEFKFHCRTHLGKFLYKCRTCPKIYFFKLSYDLHTFSHRNRYKDWECYICDGTFSPDESVEQHMKTHESAQPYKCAVCSAKFHLRAEFEMHVELQLKNPNRFACCICIEEFTLMKYARKHMKIHARATGHRSKKAAAATAST